MIVADTSALLSLTTGGVLDLVLDEFDVHTTEPVVEECRDVASFTDEDAAAATQVLDRSERLTGRDVDGTRFETSRIDAGEGSCVAVAEQLDAAFLLTDDLRALPELQALTDARVAISPVVLKALVKRGALTDAEAAATLERIADSRDWLGAPIYRRARALFDGS
jgi:predicted nucleic acid-binding protein